LFLPSSLVLTLLITGSPARLVIPKANCNGMKNEVKHLISMTILTCVLIFYLG
jgi:hypothetical protein